MSGRRRAVGACHVELASISTRCLRRPPPTRRRRRGATVQLPNFTSTSTSSSATTCGRSPPRIVLTSIGRNELPTRPTPGALMAYPPCYRREAGRPAATPAGLRVAPFRQGRDPRLLHTPGSPRCRGALPVPSVAEASACPTGARICPGTSPTRPPVDSIVRAGSTAGWRPHRSRGSRSQAGGNIPTRPSAGGAAVRATSRSALAVPRVWPRCRDLPPAGRHYRRFLSAAGLQEAPQSWGAAEPLPTLAARWRRADSLHLALGSITLLITFFRP